MSIWYPQSGITYKQYLQTNSFVRDITGEVRSSGDRSAASGRAIESRISEQTRELVASNNQLAASFGQGFDSVNSTLNWGFNRVTDALEDIGGSIDSLHADFNYNMGLLIEIAQIQSELLSNLLEKLDAVHETLKSPLLTQAREYFDIGRERLKRGLLDKALEAFKEAEAKNDTDFFIQFHIGKLYLQGIDEDDDVVDYERAKKHLLLASRYGKGEITVDPTFARFAAEALLHASLAIFYQMGEPQYAGYANDEMLVEATSLARQAVVLNPEFSEAMYHVSKYSALRGAADDSISSLQSAIAINRDFAVKVSLDKAFDAIRPRIVDFLEFLREAAKEQATGQLRLAALKIEDLEKWHPEEDQQIAPRFTECRDLFDSMQNGIESGTFFGFTDAIHDSSELIQIIPEVKADRIAALNKELTQKTNHARIGGHGNIHLYSESLKELINKINSEADSAAQFLNSSTLDGFRNGLRKADEALRLSKDARQKITAENKALADKEKRQIARGKAVDNAGSTGMGVAFIGAVIGGVIGACGGIMSAGEAMQNIKAQDYNMGNMFGGPVKGALIGALLGAALFFGIGFLVGLGKKH